MCRYGKWRADLKKHCLKITDELEISYLERRGDTDGQVLLFIHGVTIYKEMFCVIAWYFPRKFHIILIDLPGHGESKPNDKDSDYRPSVLVECVHQVSGLRCMRWRCTLKDISTHARQNIRGGGRSLIGGAHIHIFMFCVINFF